MKKKMFGGGIVAGVLAAMLFMGGMVSAGAFGEPDDHVSGESDPGGSVSEAAIGARTSESNYVKVTPCRVFDTRKVAAGAFENESRNFDARGNLAAQGGKTGGCGIPSYANSVVMTITGVTPTGKGFMRGKAFDGSAVLPQATQLNYAPGIDASNTLTLPISQGLTKEFTLGTFGNRVHLVGDVLGYFSDAQYALVDGDAAVPTFAAQSRFVGGVTKAGVGEFEIDAMGDVRGCAILVTGGHSDDTGDNNNEADLFDAELSGGNTTLHIHVYDGDGDVVDDEFTVLVQC